MSTITRFISAMLFLSVPLFPAPVFKVTAPLSLPFWDASSYLPNPGGGWTVLARANGYLSYPVLHASNGDGSAWTNSGTLLQPPNPEIGEDAFRIIRTREGGFAIAGLAADLGRRDVVYGGFLLIVDSNGAVRSRTYFSTWAISALAQTSDGGFVMATGGGPAGTIGFNEFEARLIRCDSAGQIIWSRNWASGYRYMEPKALKIAPDGSLYLALEVRRDGADSDNAAVLHVDAEGNFLRFREYEEAGHDGASDISLTPDGGFLLLGYSNGFPGSRGFYQAIGVKVDADWNTLSVQEYGPNSGNGFSAGMAAIDGKYFAIGDVVNDAGPAAWILTLDPMGRSLVKTMVTLPVNLQPASVSTLHTSGPSPVYDVQGKPGFCVFSGSVGSGLSKVYCLTMEEREQ